MVRKIKRPVSPVFTVPLDSSIHCQAQEFFKQQDSPQKAKQVYLNTLAVSAVNSYLGYRGIETDLEQSDSYKPSMQYLDTADLFITGIGALECRPVWSGEDIVQIPSDSCFSNSGYVIGYVAVQLDGALQEARLLGFAKTVEQTGMLPINQLEPLEGLLKNLSRRQQIVNSCKRRTTDLSDAIARAKAIMDIEVTLTYNKINNILDPVIQRALGVELNGYSYDIKFEELTIRLEPCSEYSWTIRVYEGEYSFSTEDDLRVWKNIKPYDVQKNLLITLDDIRTGLIFGIIDY